MDVVEETTLKEDVAIDIQNLEYEWVRQSSLYMKWSLRLGQAMDHKDNLEAQYQRLKRSLEKKGSELLLFYKRSPTHLQLPPGAKPTVDILSSTVNTNPYMVQIQDEMDSVEEKLASARRTISILTHAQTALIHKKKSLEMLTEMILSGYYPDPKLPKEVVDTLEEKKVQQRRAEHSAKIAQSAARRKLGEDLQ